LGDVFGALRRGRTAAETVTERRPAAFLAVAGTFVLLAAGELAIALLAVHAAIVDAVRNPVDPDDDQVWADLAPATTDWRLLERVMGLSREEVVACLGVPLRVRRDDRTCDGCSERFIYAFDLEPGRAPIAVCFSPQGIASGTCGGSTSGMSFDLRKMTGSQPEDMIYSWPIMVLLAVPLAVLRRGAIRMGPISPPSIR
jgi:hypothetical protein